MKAQQWLEKNYPDKETTSIYLNKQLEGVLDCRMCPSLEHIFISTSVDSSKFEIKNASYWGGKAKTKIIPCLPAQTWLDQNYPSNGTCIRKWDDGENHRDFGKTRAEIKELNISRKGLEGELDLSDFQNLEKLYCFDNWLTTLDLSNLAELEKLECSNNCLTQIIYPTNPKKITELDIKDNNINFSDLAIFSQFQNLRELTIGNWDKNKINQGIYNRWQGSLKPLKDLSKLESLDISNTDISSGLEYLPQGLSTICCNILFRSTCGVEQIAESLWLYHSRQTSESWYHLCNYQSWRQNTINQKLVSLVNQELDNEKLISSIRLTGLWGSKNNNSQLTWKVFRCVVEYLENDVIELQKELQQTRQEIAPK